MVYKRSLSFFMSEEFFLIGYDVILISIPHYKIRNNYPTRPPLVCPCCKTGSLMKQQLNFPFYPAVQLLQFSLKINRLQLGSSSFSVISLVVGLSPASSKFCKSAQKLNQFMLNEWQHLFWNFYHEKHFEYKNLRWNVISTTSVFIWKYTTNHWNNETMQ